MVITFQREELQQQVSLATDRARQLSNDILMSITQEIEVIDPLSFFEAGKSSYRGNRCYWSEPSASLFLVGLGSAFKIESRNGHQLELVEQKWNQLIKQSILPAEKRYATGPILMGGISFDPLQTKTSRWEKFPDTEFVLPEHMLTVYKGNAWLTTNIIIEPENRQDLLIEQIKNSHETLFSQIQAVEPPLTSNRMKIEEDNTEDWMNTVANAAAEIRSNGPLEKVVLARELRIDCHKKQEPVDVLYRLKEQQPMSYIFAIESGSDCFLGASPERLVKKQDKEFLSTCLAGSIARGQTIEEDEHLGQKLLEDQKNLHEHNVVVQMIKNAFERKCDTVTSPSKPTLYKVRDIQHLYTPVVGKTKKDVSLLSMVEDLHPTPALGGNPQQLSVEKIRQLEKLDRGWYAAPIGWMDFDGNGEFAVAIRSGLLQDKGASIFAGCGIVGDSNPEHEYEETQMKFRPMLSALGVGKYVNK